MSEVNSGRRTPWRVDETGVHRCFSLPGGRVSSAALLARVQADGSWTCWAMGASGRTEAVGTGWAVSVELALGHAEKQLAERGWVEVPDLDDVTRAAALYQIGAWERLEATWRRSG